MNIAHMTNAAAEQMQTPNEAHARHHMQDHQLSGKQTQANALNKRTQTTLQRKKDTKQGNHAEWNVQVHFKNIKRNHATNHLKR